MAKETALYDDELASAFEEEPGTLDDDDASLLDLDDEDEDADELLAFAMPPARGASPVAASDLPPPVNPDPPQKGLDDDAAIFDAQPAGGDRVIPAITIAAFLERDETEALIRTVAGDRRMGRAIVDIYRGGLDSAVAELSRNATPNLLILESTAGAREMIAQIDQLAEHCDEGVEVMVIGTTNDIQLYRQLTARGVSEYIVPPFRTVSIIRSIATLFTDPDAPFVGRTIAVVGAKGGVGASTIAHNLAWSISENARINATLMDLDVSFGTTALDFNQDPQQSVADALLAPERADDAVIERLLSKATDRLSLFTAPAQVNSLYDIPSEAYSTVIEAVRRNVPFVVLDLPHLWSEWMQATLVGADEVVLVCQPDLASLRNGKNILDQVTAKRPNDALPRLVLNMCGVPKRPEIPVRDFAAAMGVEPDILLPFDPHLFGLAANNGQMISETDPTAKPAQAIDHLASLITGQTVEQREKSILKKLFGK